MIYFLSNKKIEYEDIKQCNVEFVLDYFKDKEIIQADTETTGFSPFSDDLLTLQLGDFENQFVIDISTIPISKFKPLLEEKLLIFHNAKFDLKFLYREDIIPTKIYDTFIAEVIISNGMLNYRRSLDKCLERHLNIEMSKEERDLITRLGIYNDRIIKYSALDVKYLEQLREKQLVQIEKYELEKALALDNKFVCVLAYIEYCGQYLNPEIWTEKVKKQQEQLDKVKEELNTYVEDLKDVRFLNPPDLFNPKYTCNINWNSPDQVIPLFKKLGIETLFAVKGEEGFTDTLQEKYIKNQDHEIIPIYLKYQELQKSVSTYGLSFLNHIDDKTNRVHTNYKQIVSTGRMASGGKDQNDYSSGPNMQNIPAGEDRKSFTNQFDDTILTIADYSSQESRVLAEFSKDRYLVDFYLSGEADLHSYAVKLVYKDTYFDLADMSLSDIKDKYPELRQNMKGFNFALMLAPCYSNVA